MLGLLGWLLLITHAHVGMDPLGSAMHDQHHDCSSKIEWQEPWSVCEEGREWWELVGTFRQANTTLSLLRWIYARTLT
jgi:hypothetical protein